VSTSQPPNPSTRPFTSDLWRLTRIYWTSPDAVVGGVLLGLATALELATVQVAVMIADAERRIFDALADRDMGGFFTVMGVALAIITGFVIVSTFRMYVRQRLEIRWRQHVTSFFLERWMSREAYCQGTLRPPGLDNPDQRIHEDVKSYVASALGLSLSLLSAAATLVSFGTLLWRMDPIMLWVAIVYAIVATGLTHVIGRPLVPINYDRMRVEADFRYGLVHFRDNVEAVALARGEERERANARGRFRHVVHNWLQLITAQRNLMLFTTGIGQANGLLPILIGAPAYFAGQLTLGSLAQTRIAYGQFSAALAWFVNAYQEIAQWRASIARLTSLLDALDDTCQRLRSGGIRIEPVPGDALVLRDLAIALPDGRVLARADATIRAGERVAIMGPAGTGKTTLFRTIAGIWPFGSGRIEMPAAARMMFLPQRPYLPLGTLRAALTYPLDPSDVPDDTVREVMDFVGIGRLADRLDAEEFWQQTLSGDEQQRVVFARVLLLEPDWIFADDATAALDERMEKRAYDILRERFPRATLVSITQRPAVLPYHDRQWTMAPGPGGQSVVVSA
jgi:putative ATP-binding cassette transporter